MKKTTKEQKEYIDGINLWIKNEDLLIKGHNLTIMNSEAMMKLHSDTIKVNKKSLVYESKFRQKTVSIFNDWREQNDLYGYKI
jgi:hypothetical protein